MLSLSERFAAIIAPIWLNTLLPVRPADSLEADFRPAPLALDRHALAFC